MVMVHQELGGQAVLFTSKDFSKLDIFTSIFIVIIMVEFWECPDMFNLYQTVIVYLKASLLGS